MVFRHSFRLNVPLQAVVDLHRDPKNLALLTPPPVLVRINHAPQRLSDGSEMAFTMWFGPFPIRWKALIERIEGEGFQDRQLSGPFEYWVHRHSFQDLGDKGTEIQDHIEFSLKKNLFWGTIGFFMRLSLPFLFFYRSWKTRRLLE
jgi:ligand-binding SRPBCC domain-containing protein